MLKPIMLYFVFVCFKALGKAALAKHLERIQRAGIVTYGALRTTPTMILNVFLDIAGCEGCY